MARTLWISKGAEQLAFSQAGADGFHCDVAIVGSGYGGAVAAARLAGATDQATGKQARVWVLERGRERLPGQFPQRFADLPGEVRFNWGQRAATRGLPHGLFDLRMGEDVSALLGNGLGGGSLINAGVLAEPDPSIFRESPWPWQFGDKALEPHFDAVRKMLGAETVPVRPAKLDALDGVAKNMGAPGADLAQIAVTFNAKKSEAEVPQEGCISCGDCFTGCNHWAKNTLAMNYLPYASTRGAELFTGITVMSVQPVPSGWELETRFTEQQIRDRLRSPGPRLRARRVVLAAGTYGSTGILLRSQAGALNGRLSHHRLGKRFSSNGDMIAAGYGMGREVNASAEESKAPGKRGIGPTIVGMIDLRKGTVPFVVEELAIPAALRRPFEELVTTFATLDRLGGMDWSRHRPGQVDSSAINQGALRKVAVYATIGCDDAGGRLYLQAPARDGESSDDAVRVDWKDVGRQPVFTEAMRTLERAHAAAGATLIPNPMWRLLPPSLSGMLADREVAGTVFTVHPLGGCAMAECAEEGVVNHLGQVFKSERGEAVHDTLVVLDGSVVPTALGTNPCLTIAALAEYAVPQLMKQWKLVTRGLGVRVADLPHIPKLLHPKALRPTWASPRPTAIKLAERLKGTLQLPLNGGSALSFHAELELKYDPIPDLEGFLPKASKILTIPKAYLRLQGEVPEDPRNKSGAPTKWNGTALLDGKLRFLEYEPSAWWQRVLSAGWAWALNRGIRELAGLVRKFVRGLDPAKILLGVVLAPLLPFLAAGKFFKVARRWMAIASHVGEARRMVYELTVLRDVVVNVGDGQNGILLLHKNDCLIGTKRLAYVAGGAKDDSWPSPWDQITNLRLRLKRNDEPERHLGNLTVDLPYFVQHFAALLQIGSQENQPRALADLCSLFAYLGRLIGKIHFWTLRAPDYPDPYPVYEFDAASAERASTAAREIGIRTVDRSAYRLPGKVSGLDHCVVPVADDHPNGARLTRYFKPGSPPSKGTLPPVLLIHGLGAGGNTFTLPTVDRNLVQYLVQAGRDPWVLDLSTSIGLQDSKLDWDFDTVAIGDIPPALGLIKRHTGSDVDVVAHCIGAAMFCMAMLSGNVPRGLVRCAVLSQVGPLLEFPPTNRFRGYIASYFKHYLDIDEFDTACELSTFNRFLDRILAAYPYPAHEWHHHQSLLRPVLHEAYCLRAYGIYGRLFEHRNLNERTLDVLGDYLGHIKYRTYQQTIFYATMRRLTDTLGRNRYVTPENIARHLHFPICFLHGQKNEVFHPSTSRRSFDLLASIFWGDELDRIWVSDPAQRYESKPYAQGRSLRLVEIPGYGHQDCMIGEHAHRDVYPAIEAFLRDHIAAPKPVKTRSVVRAPRMGPILGWIRPHPGAKGKLLARVLFAPNYSRSNPSYAMSIVLKPRNGTAPAGTFHSLREPSEQEKPNGPPTQALDIELDDDQQECHIVVVTVHREHFEDEPARAGAEPSAEDAFGEDLDRFPLVDLPERDAAMRTSAQPYVQHVLDTCKDLVGAARTPLTAGRDASDRRYATPLSTAILSSNVMQSARTQAGPPSLCFALANCRYPATPVDREQADGTFGRLRGLLEPAAAQPAPQLLLLAGDAIYADATYGIFDPTLGIERFDQRYLEAWTAPNAREVLRRLPTYPMLDDHEVEENFEGRTGETRNPTQVAEGLNAFRSFQLLLTPAIEDPVRRAHRGHSYQISAGGFQFFVADTRAERRRNDGPHSLQATIMEPWHEWPSLADWLERNNDPADPCRPKFLVSPSVILPWSRETRGHLSYQLRSDAWDGYPQSLYELLSLIARRQVRNVVFLSGDYHASLLCHATVAHDGGEPIDVYSVVAAGLYAPYPFANTVAEDLDRAYGGTLEEWVTGKHHARGLQINYTTELVDTRDAFALLNARQASNEWLLDVEFCSSGSSCDTYQVNLSRGGKPQRQSRPSLSAAPARGNAPSAPSPTP